MIHLRWIDLSLNNVQNRNITMSNITITGSCCHHDIFRLKQTTHYIEYSGFTYFRFLNISNLSKEKWKQKKMFVQYCRMSTVCTQRWENGVEELESEMISNWLDRCSCNRDIEELKYYQTWWWKPVAEMFRIIVKLY